MRSMKGYWNDIWRQAEIEKYIGYVKGYLTWKPKFLDVFNAHNIESVCDAACGFGAYSVMLTKNGYDVCGFDISDKSVDLTNRIMQAFGCENGGYKVCSLTSIEYDDASFDAVVAHAVIDHLPLADAKIALEELFRILVPDGLLYVTFDPLSEDDECKAHHVLEDGSRLYDDGLLFRYYSDEEIHNLLCGKSIVWTTTNTRGEREFVLKKS
ncbi:MAG: class I SAM-dependent methyltransferase [Defluviitaleaceae bacterium]|nr:class I SAM-dependent methyltransferase [Defluviitaleaceae bacterium]MCL2273754.1 class I SAM-dependent methyltransferase [Defluviitaleaceae bacterium]